MSNNSRLPPDDRPPAYALPLRLYNKNLRPLVLVFTLVGAIWSIASGISYLRDRNNGKNNSDRLNSAFLALAIVYFVVFAIEFYGLTAAYLQRLLLVRVYFFTSIFGAILVSGGQLYRLIIHFIYKTDIINSCIASSLQSNNGSYNDYTQAQATSLCSQSWTNSTYWDVGLFLALTFIAAFFSTLAGSYLHQLKNPQSLRTHRVQTQPLGPTNSNYVYPLNTFPSSTSGGNPYVYGGGQHQGGNEYETGNLPVYDPQGYVPPAKNEFGPGGDTDGKEFENSSEGYELGLGGRTASTGNGRNGNGNGNGRDENESTETVTLEPRSEHLQGRFGGEGRI